LNSSLPDARFGDLVWRAVDTIRTEVPWVHDAMSRAIGSWTALVVVDGEPATIGAASAGSISVEAHARASDVTCTTTSEAILGLIDGLETALDAIKGDRVALVGSADALLAWHDVLDLFLHGAVRARGFEALLDAFRS
jgi:hypothetical protein